MSNLTPKQEAFAQAVFNGMNASDAYRSAYDADAMKDEAIHVNASKLLKNAKVALRIQALKDAIEPKIQRKLMLTKETAIERLMQISEQAVEAKQFSAGSNSLMGACKIAGLVVDKVDARLEVTESQAQVTAAALYKKQQE